MQLITFGRLILPSMLLTLPVRWPLLQRLLVCTSLCKFKFLQFARILSLSQSKAIHAVHFNVYIKVLFWNIPYYINRVFSARSPALTEQYLRWWGITSSFLELEHTTKSLFREVEGRETPSGEHRCGTRKCGNTHLPTVWEQSSCCPVWWLSTTPLLLCWMWCQHAHQTCSP